MEKLAAMIPAGVTLEKSTKSVIILTNLALQIRMKTALAIFLITFLIRILFLFQGAVSFHYDMARDAFMAQQILGGHLKVLGPPTTIDGLYHGVAYYYLIAPFYLFGGGNPVVVSFALAFIGSLAVFPIMMLSKELFKKRKYVILSALFFAFATEASQYGPWLSDPGPAVLTSALFFFGLMLWKKGNKYGIALAAFMAALSTQFEFFLLYLFVVLILFKFIFKIKVSRQEILIAIGLAFLGLSTIFIAAIKFSNLSQMSKILLGFSGITQFEFRTQFSDLFLNYLNRFADIFINNFLPINILFGGLLGLVVLYTARKNSFLLFILFSHLLIFFFGGPNSAHINVAMITPAVLGMTLLVKEIGNNRPSLVMFFLTLIFSANVLTILRVNPRGQLGLVIQKDMVLSKELALIDDSYRQAEGKEFSINTITLPLWTNTTWAYLYSWYGKEKYGYLPTFSGHDQIGLPGADKLKKVDQPLPKSFLIIEPSNGIPANFMADEISSENGKTSLVKEINYGELKLQLRTTRVDNE